LKIAGGTPAATFAVAAATSSKREGSHQ